MARYEMKRDSEGRDYLEVDPDLAIRRKARKSPFQEVPEEALEAITTLAENVTDPHQKVVATINGLLNNPESLLRLAARFAAVDVTKSRGFRYVDETGKVLDSLVVEVVIPKAQLEKYRKDAGL